MTGAHLGFTGYFWIMVHKESSDQTFLTLLSMHYVFTTVILNFYQLLGLFRIGAYLCLLDDTLFITAYCEAGL